MLRMPSGTKRGRSVPEVVAKAAADPSCGDGPKTTELIWLALALGIVLVAPNSLEIVSRLRPKPVWAWSIVALFLWTIYHFDQTTEFLYYQF